MKCLSKDSVASLLKLNFNLSASFAMLKLLSILLLKSNNVVLFLIRFSTRRFFCFAFSLLVLKPVLGEVSSLHTTDSQPNISVVS